ncbi:glutathione peroxidase [Clostridium sp. 'White wine YQ']|uniref:glutathione peroxidase n=1 Tax=Clostridium sp. 'White wine YQ' TaxID=3027474 RepID=UPI0023659E31|nr:glutathione peroxidase [Clostridium sp. 'White wine YQ']MDD7796193.1 glutathione peroxidase [Clostridium sp. 'White wine YQ']
MSIYDYSAKNINGDDVSLRKYEGKVLLIVNTASKCGFTPQYKDLEALYKKLGNEKFEILGFPCDQFANQEPGTSEDIKNFCEINYGVTFPIFQKIDVNGENAHDLFKYLKSKAPFKGIDDSTTTGKFLKTFLSEKYPETLLGDSIKWNFTKFLVNTNGEVINRFESTIEPSDIESYITSLL